MVYFFAMNFDRLYFAKQITLAELGVYGIARNLADVVSQLVARASGSVLYPSVAAAGLEPMQLRQRLLRGRRVMLALAAAGVGVFLSLSHLIIGLLYDPRYEGAAIILPILCVGVWFSILTSCNDSILMGLGRPAFPAFSNAGKLATYIIGMPLAFYYSGFIAAVAVIASGELVKYVVLWAFTRREHFHFGRDDLVLTIFFGLVALVAHHILVIAGLGGGVQQIHLRSLLEAVSI
ncbi:hypothetical protein GCM10022276_10540 [Sphingomonas limnosediminicola]|uniref:Polysaccharide biosynthesis protein n=2 Tax=Sphingomonas limnosediminicola TaxID=940133 RepID=A0ABP7L512_9SPHN